MRHTYQIAFGAAVFMTLAGRAAGVINPANGHDYQLTPSTMLWTDAESYAVSIGGHLAAIYDEAEQTWIEATILAGASSNDALWIGCTDAGTEGQWRWTTGELMSITNWEVGEPNNSLGGLPEDYGVLNWHWRYRATTVEHHFG